MQSAMSTYNNIEYELLPITYPESEQEIIFDIDNAIETDIYYIDLNIDKKEGCVIRILLFLVSIPFSWLSPT